MTSEGCDWLIEMLIQDQQSVLIQDHILLGKITVTAFNTIRPSLLEGKLLQAGVDCHLVAFKVWILRG